MKIWAKVELNREENAENLIRAFFTEFNPKNSIAIKNKQAEVEIFFDKQLPVHSIAAIYTCNIIEFSCSKLAEDVGKVEEKANSETTEPETEEEETSEEAEPETEEEEPSEEAEPETEEKESSEKTEPEAEEESPSESEEPKEEKKDSQQKEPPKKKRGRPRTKKVETTNSEKTSHKTVDIPELREIAKKAMSFEHFVKLVAEWLEMGQRKEFFEKLACVSTKVDNVSWKELEKALDNEDMIYTSWDRIWTGQQVSEKLKGYSVTLLPLLNVIRQYKDYSFGNEQPEEFSTEQGPEEEASTEQETEETAGAEEEARAETEETTAKSEVKMKCMPKIPQFEQALRSIDKSRTVETRVRGILIAMGVNKMDSVKQNEIFEIANTAMSMRRMDMNIILLKANIPVENSTHARMTFSQFINDFVCDHGSNKRVNLLDFLQQLQNVVMDESEIQSLSD